MGSENPQQGGSGRLSRRRLLRTGGLVSALAMSGCSGLFGSPGADTEPETRISPALSAETVTFDPAKTTQTASVDEERVENTLADLSLTEKIGQMTQLEPKHRGRPFSVERATKEIDSLNVGSVLFGGANPPGSTGREAAKYFNEVQRATMDSNGVPLLIGLDAVHGNATVSDAAVFPHQVGLGATWNTDLAGSVAAATSRSLTAMGVNWTFSPVADVAYDPRWGRFYESFSEDPHVTSEFVEAMVGGYEQIFDDSKRVAASVKHFAGYSLPKAGNDREPADVSLRTLEDVVLPPYEAGVDAGAETVMANSGSINGIPAHASGWLQNTVLRERWGFDGLVVSDWTDIHRLISQHGYASDLSEAIEMAVNAGVDVYMAPHPNQIEPYQSRLSDLVDDGRVSESRIDEAVRRVLRVKDRLGLFEDPTVPIEEHTGVVTDQDRALARQAASQSLTLLTNKSSVLPLGDDIESVLVTGPAVDSVSHQLGGWTMGWQGPPSAESAPETVTMREGIEAVAPSSVDVTVVETDAESFENESEVRSATSDADVAVVAIGEGSYAEGQGDIDDLSFSTGQQEVVAVLTESDVATVGVIAAGRPRGSPELFEQLDASVMAYYPGSEGGTAVGEALFGETPPAGRLPFTWPRSTGQIPYVITNRAPPHDPAGTSGGRGAQATGPLFPFAHGGSYVRVSHEGISLDAKRVSSVTETPRNRATVEVRNAGDRATDEVIVLLADYDHVKSASDSPAIPPARQVVGFDRIHVEAGQTVSASVPVSLDALAVTAGGVTADGDRVVPAGEYTISSRDASTQLTIQSTASLSS